MAIERTAAGLAGLTVLSVCLAGCFNLPTTPGVDAAAEEGKVAADGKPLPEVSSADAGSEQAPFHPDWKLWYPDLGEMYPGPFDLLPDGPMPPGPETDGSVPVPWDCHLKPEELAPAILTGSFVRSAQPLGMINNMAIAGSFCGWDVAIESPEYVSLFEIKQPASLAVSVGCDAPCFAYLMKEGCSYASTVACWSKEESEVFGTAELMPGLYLVGVEYILDPLLNPIPEYFFDLHVALNNTFGQEQCPAESVSKSSGLEAGPCDVALDSTTASSKIQGSLSWPQGDDFFLACGELGVEADPVGGMPDVVHAYVADFPEEGTRVVDVSVVFDDFPGDDDASFILALTTAPCGAASAVVDCEWGPAGELTLSGITVFRGQTLYAVIDGMGEDAFDLVSPAPYTLTWTEHSDCP